MTTRFRLLSSLAALCTTLLLMLSPAVALAVPSWSVVTQVTAPGATTTQAPQFLSGTDGSITAITAETVSSISTILARHSTDGGTTWGSPVTLSAPGIASSDVAAIRLNNGHFAVAWAEASGASNVNHIRLITSSNNGLTWSTPQTISTAGSNPYAANKPHLAAVGSADIAVGYQQSDGSNDIAMVRNSASQLQSWTQAVSLSVAGSNAKFVTPVVNSAGDIVVSWVLVASDSTKQTKLPAPLTGLPSPRSQVMQSQEIRTFQSVSHCPQEILLCCGQTPPHQTTPTLKSLHKQALMRERPGDLQLHSAFNHSRITSLRW